MQPASNFSLSCDTASSISIHVWKVTSCKTTPSPFLLMMHCGCICDNHSTQRALASFSYTPRQLTLISETSPFQYFPSRIRKGPVALEPGKRLATATELLGECGVRASSQWPLEASGETKERKGALTMRARLREKPQQRHLRPVHGASMLPGRGWDQARMMQGRHPPPGTAPCELAEQAGRPEASIRALGCGGTRRAGRQRQPNEGSASSSWTMSSNFVMCRTK